MAILIDFDAFAEAMACIDLAADRDSLGTNVTVAERLLVITCIAVGCAPAKTISDFEMVRVRFASGITAALRLRVVVREAAKVARAEAEATRGRVIDFVRVVAVVAVAVSDR